MTRRVFMFMPEFAQLVEDGRKCQSIRPLSKRAQPAVGDIADLRQWMGKPYRSKHRTLRTSKFVAVRPVYLWEGELKHIELDDEFELSGNEIEQFAYADGFTSPTRMFEWFNKNHGLPFDGMLYQWEGKGLILWQSDA